MEIEDPTYMNSDMLRTYYSHFFPSSLMHRWLTSYGKIKVTRPLR